MALATVQVWFFFNTQLMGRMLHTRCCCWRRDLENISGLDLIRHFSKQLLLQQGSDDSYSMLCFPCSIYGINSLYIFGIQVVINTAIGSQALSLQLGLLSSLLRSGNIQGALCRGIQAFTNCFLNHMILFIMAKTVRLK